MNIRKAARIAAQISVLFMAYELAQLPLWQFILVAFLFVLIGQLNHYDTSDPHDVIDEDHYA